MCTRENRHSDCISIFLDSSLHNLFWSLMKSGVDNFESSVTKRAGNHFGAAIMAI
jgi:hypothetical protein